MVLEVCGYIWNSLILVLVLFLTGFFTKCYAYIYLKNKSQNGNKTGPITVAYYFALSLAVVYQMFKKKQEQILL